MHKYERYIIYPLLIIALFYGMSGSDVIETNAQKVYDEIVAEQIKVIGTKEDGGTTIINHNGMAIYNKDNKLALSLQPNGFIRTYDEGDETTYLGSMPSGGGTIAIFNDHEKEVGRITITKADENGEGGGHGVLVIHDKYHEDYRSYGHRGY
jgi:hypothetical protein